MSRIYIFLFLVLFNFLITGSNTSEFAKGVCCVGMFPLLDINRNNSSDYGFYKDREIEDQTFSVFSPDEGAYIEVDFIHYVSVSGSNFYIESDYFNVIDLGVIDQIVNAFTTLNNYGLLDNSPIRMSIESMLASSPELSDEINILFLDIKDGYNPSSGSDSYTAGFFDPNDQILGGLGNDSNIIYLDLFPTDISMSNIKSLLFTLAHEYQHLLHWNVDVCEGNFDWLDAATISYIESEYNCTPSNKWVNEGLSDIIGYLHTGIHRDFTYYTNDMSIGLDSWPHYNEGVSTFSYYSKSALFFHYLYESLGVELILDIFSNQRYQTIQGVIDEIEDHIDFDLVFKNFIGKIISNSINNINLEDIKEDYLISNLPIDDDNLLSDESLIQINQIHSGEPYSSYNGYFDPNYYLKSVSTTLPNHTLIIINDTILNFNNSSQLIEHLSIDNDSPLSGGYVSSIMLSENTIEIDADLYFDILFNSLYVYPNPINSSQTFSVLFFPKSEVDNIDIYNLNGQLVTSIPAANKNYLSYSFTENIASGMYFIGYRSEDNTFKKITVLK